MATTLKSIDKRIATFTTNRDKLRNDAHEIAMLILNHAAPEAAGPNAQGTGDCTRALKLMEAMPSSWAEQMDAWFRAYSPIRVVVKNGKCEYDPAYKKLAAEQKVDGWNLEGAAVTPFWEAKKEAPPKPALDFATMVRMVEQLGKRIAKQVEEEKVKPEDVESAKALSEQLAKLKVRRIVVNDNAPASGAGSTTGKAKVA